MFANQQTALIHPATLVNRVQWLRSKARHERWHDEHLLARAEMTWIPRGYRHRADTWMQRMNGLSPGHDAFAARQVAMWESLAGDAYERFTEVLSKEIARHV